MCLRFVFLLITQLAAWLWLSRRAETWKTAEILILRHCACRKPRPGHATRRYSLIRPPARVCRRTRYWSRSTGSGSGFSGAAPCRERCGRCWLVALVLVQDPPQMVLVPDEGAVQELAAASPDPALGDRVHTR